MLNDRINKIIRFSTLLVIAGIIFFVFSAQAYSAHSARITWKKTPGVTDYLLEVKNRRGRIVYTGKTSRSYLYAPLRPGKYSIRITGFNKFRKRHGTSEWTPLIVRPVPSLKVWSIKPRSFGNLRMEGIQIRGRNFRKGMKLYLKKAESGNKNSEKYHVKNFKYFSKYKVVFDLDLSNARPGKYYLIAANKKGRSCVKKINVMASEAFLAASFYDKKNRRWFQKRPGVPDICSIEPDSFFIKKKPVSIKAKGRYLKNGVKVKLLSGRTALDTLVDYKSPGELEFTIPVENQKPGNYKVSVINPDRKISIVNLSIALKDPGQGLASLGGLLTGVGYHANLPFGCEWGDIYSPSYTGGFIYLGFDFSGFKPLSYIPVIRHMGMEYDFSFANYSSIEKLNRGDSDLSVYTNGAGLYLKCDLSLPIYFIFRFNGGIVLSDLRVKRLNIESENLSFDYYYKYGLSLRLPLNQFFFAECGFNVQNILYSEETFCSVTPFVLVGFRL